MTTTRCAMAQHARRANTCAILGQVLWARLPWRCLVGLFILFDSSDGNSQFGRRLGGQPSFGWNAAQGGCCGGVEAHSAKWFTADRAWLTFANLKSIQTSTVRALWMKSDGGAGKTRGSRSSSLAEYIVRSILAATIHGDLKIRMPTDLHRGVYGARLFLRMCACIYSNTGVVHLVTVRAILHMIWPNRLIYSWSISGDVNHQHS